MKALLFLLALSFNTQAWDLVYEHDKFDVPVSGSEAALWQAASEARDIKIEVLWAGVYRMFTCQHVHRSATSTAVLCEAQLNIGQITIAPSGVPSGGALMRYGVGLFSSAGHEQWYAVLGNDTALSKDLLEMGIRWFVRY